MRDYVKRLVELAIAGFLAGGAEYAVTEGVELSGASLRGLLVSAGLVAYGVVVRKLGADNRPTVQ